MSKFYSGQAVYSLENPSQKLIVRRFLDRIYYCMVANNPDHRELVFFERELGATEDNSVLPKDPLNPETSEYRFWS